MAAIRTVADDQRDRQGQALRVVEEVQSCSAEGGCGEKAGSDREHRRGVHYDVLRPVAVERRNLSAIGHALHSGRV